MKIKLKEAQSKRERGVTSKFIVVIYGIALVAWLDETAVALVLDAYFPTRMNVIGKQQ